MPYTGGYQTIQLDLIQRNGANKHTAALPDPVSASALSAINTVQSTPWQINQWICGIMEAADESGLYIGGIPNADPEISVERRLPDNIWQALSKEGRKVVAARRKDQWEQEIVRTSVRRTFGRILLVAKDLAGQGPIWFPHTFDWRGRMYPAPQDLNPQGDQVAKSLLMFSEGKPIGDAGFYWLRIALANAAGQDKLAFEDRLKWVNTNHELIVASVANPFGENFWLTLDEPWQFLAIAKEYAESSIEGPSYSSMVPVHVDATCSGMQHLSAMGLDLEGARKTNLLNTGKREDLYSEVADGVKTLVAFDASKGSLSAVKWLGKVDRKTVKRAVMTTPYGVTARGISDQLIVDGFCRGLEGTQAENAAWLRDKIVKALEETVSSAKEIMGWLQDTAYMLAKENIPFDWTAASGFRIRQAYYKEKKKRIQTLFGETWIDLQIADEDLTSKLDAQKAHLAAAPNYVHSQDASHLVLSVNSARERGVSHFAVIHDSFGTHAADVETLGKTLREQFVAMYSIDRLELLEEEIKEYAPGIGLPTRPSRGSLDITSVLDSPYFFS